MTPEQIDLAYEIGTNRNKKHLAWGTSHRYGKVRSEDDEDTDGLAAVAEAFVADMFGLSWNMSSDRPDDGVDVGDCIGVRHTQRTNGCLLLHKPDADDLLHILVIGEKYSMKAVGWLRTGDGKKPEYWRASVPRPAYFVPQHVLRPMKELKLPRPTQ